MRKVYRHELVTFIPEELESGVLYVSMEFATTAHICMCGCGKKVVAPIATKAWKVIFDGETMSLTPSIGNWSFPCQSHYWLRGGLVHVAPEWTRREISAARDQDADTMSSVVDETPATAGLTAVGRRLAAAFLRREA